MVTIDWTVSIGNMLTVITLVSVLVVAYIKLMGRVDHLETRFTSMDKTMEKLAITVEQIGNVLSNSKVLEHRLDRVENDIYEIKHGEGFVFPITRYRPPEPREE